MGEKWLVGNRNVIDSVENVRLDGRMIQGIIKKFPVVNINSDVVVLTDDIL